MALTQAGLLPALTVPEELNDTRLASLQLPGRFVPDIRPYLYPAGYPVSFAGYPARKTVKNQKQFRQIKLY